MNLEESYNRNQTLDLIKSKFEEYKFEKFGAKLYWQIELIMKHEFLSEYMDVFDQKKTFKIGIIQNQIDFEQIKKEVAAMENYAINNPEILKTERKN